MQSHAAWAGSLARFTETAGTDSPLLGLVRATGERLFLFRGIEPQAATSSGTGAGRKHDTQRQSTCVGKTDRDVAMCLTAHGCAQR